VLAAVLVVPGAAHATFPGKNGKIAFDTDSTSTPSGIWTVNPDGTGGAPVPIDGLDPAWSPDGTKLAAAVAGPSDPDCDFAFIQCNSEIYVGNADGTNMTRLTFTMYSAERDPTWTPDGQAITFTRYTGLSTDEIVSINADGTGENLMPIPGQGRVFGAAWSPDGRKLSYTRILPESGTDPTAAIFIWSADGSGTTRFCCDDVNALLPDWSPDQRSIVFNKATNIVARQNIDGSGYTELSNHGFTPQWSPDGTKIVFEDTQSNVARVSTMNADGSNVQQLTTRRSHRPSWQPIPINAYPRPRGASPLRVSLVPAYRACSAPNTTHGAPLAFPSCTPPQPASERLTTGTPDANGRPVRMSAALTLRVVTGDVEIQAHLNDVANSDLTDYSGTLRAQLPLRITDKFNTPHPGGPGAATTQPFVYGFTIPCASNPGPTTGSDCTVATSMNALTPGTHADGRRAVWQLGQVRVFDGGADQDGSTTADNTVFATQGVFVP
jgi:WD40-like Beta Propeller Repeat